MKNAFFAILTLLFLMPQSTEAQRFFTREGDISFFSNAQVEKIEAHNTSATSVMDIETGQMEFAVLIKGFQFEKSLMQEHFNENYMESSKYPKATFKGALADASAVNWQADGTYPVEVKGDLTIHGVTNEVVAPGTITIQDGQIAAVSEFTVAVADYDIEIPSVVRDNIAKEVKITVDINYEPLQ